MELYRLTNETIDLLSERIGTLYTDHGCTKKETMRAKLLLEEALLKYQSHFGEDIELHFRTYRILTQTRFCVRIRAASFDPFTLEENPMAFMLQTILSGVEGNAPTWKYQNLENEIVFTLHKKASHSSLIYLALAVALALIAGILARTLFPQDALAGFVRDYVEPFSNAYAGLFCVMSVLMTLFAITLSIVHIGDMSAVGALGGRILRRFYLMTILLVAVLTLPLLPFFDLSGNSTVSLTVKSFYDILIGFIPNNFVAPFLNFNSVHIMIIGVMFGFSLLAMGQKGDTLVKVFNECNLVAVYTNGFLNRFIFLYAALKVFAIVTLSEFASLGGAAKMVGVILLGEILLFVFYAAYACFKTKVPLRTYLRTMMPAVVICLSSANFGAACTTLFDSLFAMDTDEDTANLGANLGSVFFQPACTLMFVISTLFMAQAYGVNISLGWVLTSVLLSIILVAAIPNIPGAAVGVLTLLYSQLGLPSEAVALMIAINAVLQFPTVAVDCWCLQAEVTCLSHSLQKQSASVQ